MNSERGSVVVTGATGLVGRALVPALQQTGYDVRGLGRQSGADVTWDPARGRLPAEAVAGAQAVVHLAGETLSGRWTAAKKREIKESRETGTRLLAETLAGLTTHPEVLVSASAVGYYGDRGAEVLSEESAGGTGFLAEVCAEWEAATRAATEAGIRVVHLRLGVVASSHGGAVPMMLKPIRMNLGGRIGSGKQYLSWIALPDVVDAVRHVLERPELRGAVNATAPEAVTNAEFVRTAAQFLGKPSGLAVPAFALRALLGEMADEVLLASQRVEPRRLLASGFEFKYRGLREVLEAVLAGRV